jgi:hypothetical protein
VGHEEFQTVVACSGLSIGVLGYFFASLAWGGTLKMRKEIAQLRAQLSQQQADISKLQATRAN